jgi:hypothetical protein
MDIEIEFGLAAAAQHKFHVAANLLGAFGAILAAGDRLVPPTRQCFTPSTRKRPLLFDKFDNRIHPGATMRQIVINGHDSVQQE